MRGCSEGGREVRMGRFERGGVGWWEGEMREGVGGMEEVLEGEKKVAVGKMV